MRVDATARRDAAGKTFVQFAVDESQGWEAHPNAKQWQNDQIVGCVYVDSQTVFVKRGKDFHPAAAKLGKKTKPVAGACQGTAAVATR